MLHLQPDNHFKLFAMKKAINTFQVLSLALLAAVIMTGCNCNNDSQPTTTIEKTDNGKIAIETIMTRTSIR